MQAFEYKVIPAPNKGKKAKGVKTPEDRFANGVETILNEMAAEGWEFQRAEMLPSEERSGLTGSKTNWRNLLVFRRSLAPEPASQAEPTPAAAVLSAVAAPQVPETAPAPALSSDTGPNQTGPDTATVQKTTTEAPETPHSNRPHSDTGTPQLVATAGDPEAPPEAVAIPGPGARTMIADDGVEEISPVSGLTAALKKRAGLKDGPEENQ